MGFSPDPFSSRPNIKEEKAIWLCEINVYGSNEDYIGDGELVTLVHKENWQKCW